MAEQPVLALDQVPSYRPDVRVRNVRGGYLVAVANNAFELSETASFIWKQINGQNSIADIGRLLATEYDIDTDTATADTKEILEYLATTGSVVF
ncbi:PqqD family peptide modification chaperone [Streptomyces sp. NBC_01298]|uniref:PqqD family peptide modification chaperone n=1 Tax=Streptomyces sp. NBC_01298 TaxID=2903817 RepID=UPI002E0DC91F|nr:PqqD family peptide modification chaperone [Streptomyces sp. NBC_01298]